MKHSISALWQQGVLSGEHLVKVGIGMTRAGVLAPLRPDRLARLLWRAWRAPAYSRRLLEPIGNIPPSEAVANFYAENQTHGRATDRNQPPAN